MFDCGSEQVLAYSISLLYQKTAKLTLSEQGNKMYEPSLRLCASTRVLWNMEGWIMDGHDGTANLDVLRIAVMVIASSAIVGR